MRLASAIGTCWLATVVILAGCSTRTVTPKTVHVLAAKASSTADTGFADPAPVRLRRNPVRVPHIEGSQIRRARESAPVGSGSSIRAEIARETAGMRTKWESRRREMESIRPDPELRVDSEQQSALKSSDLRVTSAMLAVEKEYAPRYLNCRMRVRLLESRLTDAVGPVRDSLLRKLEQAGADLAAVDEAYAKDMDLARLSPGPIAVTDDLTKDARADKTADSRPDGRAGGGPD